MFIIEPTDLAVAKLFEFSERDRDDVRRLVGQRMLESELLSERAMEALADCVGDVEPVRRNLEQVMNMIARADGM